MKILLVHFQGTIRCASGNPDLTDPGVLANEIAGTNLYNPLILALRDGGSLVLADLSNVVFEIVEVEE